MTFKTDVVVGRKLPLTVRIYFFTNSVLENFFRVVRSCFIGFWLGILKREYLHTISAKVYDDEKLYQDKNYNQSGLKTWEKSALDLYFKKCNSFLVMGAGGGREVLALLKLGYDADGFECNPRLVECANALLNRQGFTGKVFFAPPDECANTTKIYDGAIVGWGSYMHIQGREQRINFLKALRSKLRKRSPILLSFFHRQDMNSFKIITGIGNVIKWMARDEYLTEGDCLIPDYAHFFTKEKISMELNKAGFNLKFYSTEDYGHAIGICR